MNFLFLIFLSLSSFANLQVFPTRVVLDSKDRTAQLSVRHMGNKPETYKISLVYYKMQPDGQMFEAKADEVFSDSAERLVRYSPKQVDLKPTEEQVIRILGRPRPDMKDGDYRIHIRFEPQSEPDKTTGSGIALNLKAKVAVAVPIIWKQGKVENKIQINGLKLVTLENNQPGFMFDLQQEGNGFFFGDMAVTFTPKDGKTEQVGLVKGVSSYLAKRMVRYPLNEAAGKSFHNGKLELTIKSAGAENGKTLATSSVDLK